MLTTRKVHVSCERSLPERNTSFFMKSVVMKSNAISLARLWEVYMTCCSRNVLSAVCSDKRRYCRGLNSCMRIYDVDGWIILKWILER
jgi:hypothetical protein